MTLPVILIIVFACVLAVASLLYGIFRKFSQMSWIAWQLPLVFLLTFLLRLMPEGIAGGMQFAITLFAVFVLTALIVGGGAVLRLAMHKKKLPAHPLWRFLDHVVGGLTAVLDYVVIVLFFASAALAFCYYVITPPAFLADFYLTGFWVEFLAESVFDFFIVSILVLSISGGWQVGLARTIVIWIMLALTFCAVVLSLWLACAVPPFVWLTNLIATHMNAPTGVAYVVGAGVTSLVLFIVLFVLICLLGGLLVKLIRKIRYTHVWGFLDGLLGALLGFAVAAAVLAGLYFAVNALAGGELSEMLTAFINNISASLAPDGSPDEATGPLVVLENVLAQLLYLINSAESWAQKLIAMLVSSPVSRGFMALFGA